MGIKNLDIQNTCLLSKWLFKLFNEDGVWQNLLRKRYLTNKTLSQISKKPGDSQFWSGLMKVKDQFLIGGSFSIQSGTQIRFWEDTWLGDKPLCKRYPALYSIVKKKNATVATVLSTTPLKVSFRRAIVGENLKNWFKLVASVAMINLNENNDLFHWDLNKDGPFSVKFMYTALIQEGVVASKSPIWKIKVSLKIKIFFWYLQKGVTLTKDNLAKRNWQENTNGCLCSSLETIQHLFFDWYHTRFIWNTVHITFGIQPPQKHISYVWFLA